MRNTMRHRLLGFYNWLLAPIPFGFAQSAKIAFLRGCGVSIGKRCVILPAVKIRGDGYLAIGDDCVIKSEVVIESCGEIRIGNRVEINHGTYISAIGNSKIVIGDDTRVAHGVSLKGSTHEICGARRCVAGESVFKDIVVGGGSWLCTGCILLPGVTVGRRNVIAAGAVVTKNTPDNALMAGVPATCKKIYEESYA